MLAATMSLATAAASAVVLASAGCNSKRKPSARVDDAAVAQVAAAPAAKARPLDDPGLAALAAVTISGAHIHVAQREPGQFGAIVTAADGTSATVAVAGCFDCTALDVAAWEAERASLSALLAPAPGDTLVIDRVEPGPSIRLRAHRTTEGVPESLVLLRWNDGATELAVTCSHLGADDTACATLVATAMTAYLPALTP